MIKTLTFAAMHMTVAFSVVYLMTGSVAVGGAVAFIEPLCNTVAYFLHEKYWDVLRRRRSESNRPSSPSMSAQRRSTVQA